MKKRFWLVPFKGNWVEVREASTVPHKRVSKHKGVTIKVPNGIDCWGRQKSKKAPLAVTTWVGGRVLGSYNGADLRRMGIYLPLDSPIELTREALIKMGLGGGP